MRKEHLIIILLVILNAAIRIPYISHEFGNDSFFVHWYGESIIQEGRPSWLLHPSTLFGLFPFSIPTLVPYLLATTSLMTGASIEMCILLLCAIFPIIGIIGVYLLAKETSGDTMVSIIAAFIYSLSPLYISFTYWTISARGLFITMIPMLFFLIIKWYNGRCMRVLLLVMFLFFSETLVHRMYFVLVPFFLASFVLSMTYFHRSIQERLIRHKRSIVIGLMTVFSIFFFLQFSNISFFKPGQYGYIQGRFFRAGTYDDWKAGNLDNIKLFLNMAINYTSRNGIFFVFLPIGVFVWLDKILKGGINFGEMTLLLFFILGSMIFMLGLYASLLYLSTFSILSAVGLKKFIDEMRGIFEIRDEYILVPLVLGSLVFSGMMTYYAISLKQIVYDSEITKPAEYAGAMFIRNRMDGTTLSNNKITQMTGFSYKPIFPFIYFSPPPELLSYGFVDGSDLTIRPTLRLSPDMDTIWYVDVPLDIENSRSTFGGSDVSENVRVIETYDIKGVLIYDEDPKISSQFYSLIKDEENKIYSNKVQSIYLIKSYLGR